MRAFEAEFEQLLEMVGAEVRTCVTHTYGSLAFNFVAGSDPRILDLINRNANFWNSLLGANQTAAFMALGRIYDDDRRTWRVESLLRYAENHVGIFTRPALQQRKIDQGLNQQDAERYVQDAFELQRGGLARVTDFFEGARALYREKAEPIRHKLFAHAAKHDRTARDELFANLAVRDLERMALVPYVVYEVLWQLFMNGEEPRIPDDVPMTIGDVMTAGPAPYTSTWWHLHVAADTKEFLESLVESNTFLG